MYFIYIIESKKDGRYYVGQTERLDERIKRHNEGRNLSTKAYIPWALKWWKGFDTRSEAIKIESKIKRIKKRTGIEKYVKEEVFRGVAQPG
ncbi:MAG: GIY-YIG nuclease family protein [Bacteroidales bacterium]